MAEGTGSRKRPGFCYDRGPTRNMGRGFASMDWLKTLAPAFVCAVLAGWLAWLASAPSIAITPDSVQYISAAQSLAEGAGVSTRVTEVAENRGRLPLSAWPPLYPLILATGSERLESGQRVVHMDWVRAINLAALCLTFFPFAWLARVCVGGSAWLFCLLWFASVRPTHLLASFAWSETLFVLLTMSGLAFTVRALVSEESERRRGFWFLSAGIAAALATLTRYLGISLVLSLAITVLLRSEEFSPRRTLRRIGLVLGPAIVLLAIWLGRNLILTGHLFGSTPRATEHAATRALLDTLLTIGRDWVLPSSLPGAIMVPAAILTGSLAIWLLWNVAVRFGPETFERHPLQLTAATALTQYVWIYLAMLLLSSSTIALDPVNTRLLAPIYPCLLLLMTALVREAVEELPIRSANLALGTLTLIFLFQILATAQYLVAPRESRSLTAPYWRTVAWSDEEIDRTPQIRYLRHLPAESVVLTNVWEMVTFATGLPTKVWPEAMPEPIENWPHRLAGSYLLWDPSYRSYLPDPRTLLGDQSARSLRLLGAWDGVMLYRVEPEGGAFIPSYLNGLAPVRRKEQATLMNWSPEAQETSR